MHQMIRCCYFTKTKNDAALELCIDCFRKYLLQNKIKPKLVMETLGIMLTSYKMAMMLSSLKSPKFVSEMMCLILSNRYIDNHKGGCSITPSHINQYFDGFVNLILSSNEFIRPALLFIDFVKKLKICSHLAVIKEYFNFLRKTDMSSEDLRKFYECLSSAKNDSSDFVECAVIISKTMVFHTQKLRILSDEALEILFNIISLLMQIVRSHRCTPESMDATGSLCRECKNIKRHIVVQLVNGTLKIIEYCGKNNMLTAHNFEKFVSFVEYVLYVAIDGLKCASKKQCALNFIIFIYNMVVTWQIFGKTVFFLII